MVPDLAEIAGDTITLHTVLIAFAAGFVLVSFSRHRCLRFVTDFLEDLLRPPVVVASIDCRNPGECRDPSLFVIVPE